jgi:hypothetical protein
MHFSAGDCREKRYQNLNAMYGRLLARTGNNSNWAAFSAVDCDFNRSLQPIAATHKFLQLILI